MRVRFLPLLLALCLPACTANEPPTAQPAPDSKAVPDGPKQASASPAAPQDKKQFGLPITETTTTPLASILDDPSRFDGKTIRTEGMVSAVCQSMGCWMEIGDATGNAHIKMAGHSFLVPKSSAGRRAVVQGRTLTSPDEGGSCAQKDGCRGEAEKQTGRVAKVDFEATGVEFLD